MSPLDQGLSRTPLEGCLSDTYPISRSPALGGVIGDYSGLSSPSLSRLGDSVWNIWTRETEGMVENPLEHELLSVLLRMILEDGCSITLPRLVVQGGGGGGVAAVTLRFQNK